MSIKAPAGSAPAPPAVASAAGGASSHESHEAAVLRAAARDAEAVMAQAQGGEDPAATLLVRLLERHANPTYRSALVSALPPELVGLAAAKATTTELQALQKRELAERRGGLNRVSDAVMDLFSNRGRALDQAVQRAQADFQGAAASYGVGPERLSQVSSDIEAADRALDRYDALKKNVGQVVGGLGATAGMLVMVAAAPEARLASAAEALAGAARESRLAGLAKGGAELARTARDAPFFARAWVATNAALLGTKTAIEGRSYLGPQMAQDALVGAVMFGTMGFMMRAGIQGRVAEAASDSGLAGALAGQVRRMGGSLESRLAEAAESSPFAKLAARTGAHLAAASDAGVARRIGGAVQGAAMSGMGSVTVGTLLASTAPGTWSNGVAAGLRQVASRVATGAKLSIPLGVATGFAMPPAEASAAPGAAPEAESTASLGGTRPDPKWLLLHSAGGEAHRLVNMLLFNRSASGGAAGRSALPVLEGEPLSGTSDKPGGKGG